MTRKITSFAIVAGAALLAACQVIAGIERVHKVDEETLPENEGGTSGTSGKPANDPCVHIDPPVVPDKAADPKEIPAFYLATSKLSLVHPAENGIGGYDLDGACTCDPRKGTAFDGGSSCTPRSGSVKCDPDGGVDNQGASLFATFYKLSGRDLDESFNSNVLIGASNIMLYISGWNGEANDLDVSVGIFVSQKAADGKSPGANVTGPYFGQWTYPSTVQPTGGPNGQGTGYVSNGTLVVRNAGIVKVLFGGAGLTFNDAVVIGALSFDPTTTKAKFAGVVGGRIRDEELLGAAGQIGIGGQKQACDDQTIFALVKNSICSSLDIGHALQADFKGAECDSVSSSIAITALETTLDTSNGPTDAEPSKDEGNCTPAKVNARDPTMYKCN